MSLIKMKNKRNKKENNVGLIMVNALYRYILHHYASFFISKFIFLYQCFSDRFYFDIIELIMSVC